MKTAPSRNEVLVNRRTKPNARKVADSECNIWIAEEKRNLTQQMGSVILQYRLDWPVHQEMMKSIDQTKQASVSPKPITIMISMNNT